MKQMLLNYSMLICFKLAFQKNHVLIRILGDLKCESLINELLFEEILCFRSREAELVLYTSVFLKYLEKHDLTQMQETITEYVVYVSYHEKCVVKTY